MHRVKMNVPLATHLVSKRDFEQPTPDTSERLVILDTEGIDFARGKDWLEERGLLDG